MSKHDSAPTHGWVISSKINKWLALIFVLFLLVSFMTVSAIRYSIMRDCSNVYKRDLKIATFWIHIEAGSTKPECPAYDG